MGLVQHGRVVGKYWHSGRSNETRGLHFGGEALDRIADNEGTKANQSKIDKRGSKKGKPASCDNLGMCVKEGLEEVTRCRSGEKD